MRPLGIPNDEGPRRMQGAPSARTGTNRGNVTADPNSYGFRTKRSPGCDDGMSNPVNQPRVAQWILEGDIRGCFDNISHDWLLTYVPMDKVILRKWSEGRIRGRRRFMGGAPPAVSQEPVLHPCGSLCKPWMQGMHRTRPCNPRPSFSSCMLDAGRQYLRGGRS